MPIKIDGAPTQQSRNPDLGAIVSVAMRQEGRENPYL